MQRELSPRVAVVLLAVAVGIAAYCFWLSAVPHAPANPISARAQAQNPDVRQRILERARSKYGGGAPPATQ